MGLIMKSILFSFEFPIYNYSTLKYHEALENVTIFVAHETFILTPLF